MKDKFLNVIKNNKRFILLFICLAIFIVILINVLNGNIYYEDKKIYASAFVNTKTVDTTGAGDTFCACVLGSILEYGLKGLSEQKIYHMLCLNLLIFLLLLVLFQLIFQLCHVLIKNQQVDVGSLRD